jgi:hypothetical protein
MKTRSIRAALCLAVLAAFAALTTPRSATAADAAITWNNVTLGAPASTLRPLVGDPLRVVAATDGTARIARYWLPGLSPTAFLVIERRGYIEAFSATTKDVSAGGFEAVPPDPSGVHLGDTLASVKALHPDFHAETDEDGVPELVGNVSNPTAGIVYDFKNERVRNFQWGILVDKALPELPPIAGPAGDSVDSAILDLQKTESTGVNWEYLYLGFHRCDNGTPWTLQKQSLFHSGGRAYDRLHVVCPATKAERDFYFDISSYFGKL